MKKETQGENIVPSVCISC